jgi:hypothetical protein
MRERSVITTDESDESDERKFTAKVPVFLQAKKAVFGHWSVAFVVMAAFSSRNAYHR